MGGGKVLELVDEQVTVRGLHPTALGPVLQQALDRAVDLLVEVDRPGAGQGLAVRPEGGGQAGHVVTFGLDLLRVAEAEPDGAQPFEVGRGRVGVGPTLALR